MAVVFWKKDSNFLLVLIMCAFMLEEMITWELKSKFWQVMWYFLNQLIYLINFQMQFQVVKCHCKSGSCFFFGYPCCIWCYALLTWMVKWSLYIIMLYFYQKDKFYLVQKQKSKNGGWIVTVTFSYFKVEENCSI